MVRRSGEFEREGGRHPEATVSVFGRAILQLWTQAHDGDSALPEPSDDGTRPGWTLHRSHTGRIMPHSAAVAKQSEEDGIPRKIFMPDEPLPNGSKDPYSTMHPLLVELGPQKMTAEDGSEILTQIILSAMQSGERAD